MTKQTAGEQIIQEVTSWPGVEAGPGRRGEFAFRVHRHEIGHLHGSRPHPVFPDREGLAARQIETDADTCDVIELLRLNYQRAIAREGVPPQAA